MSQTSLVARIDTALPQTQCTRCGYPGCRAYAEAVADGAADINQCPPGGATTVQALARLLGVAAKPLDPAYGAHPLRRRAVIDESRCIGCRKCIEACPVDAIVGARKWMHTVVAAHCTGCELCLPPCPVDCIDLVPATPAAAPGPWPEYAQSEVAHWRRLTEARRARQARNGERSERRAAPLGRGRPVATAVPAPEDIRAEIQAAVERVRRRRSGSGP